MKLLLIGIAGGTGAGKSTIANWLRKELGETVVTVIPQDAYYKDRGHLSPEERKRINYDHPDAYDVDTLISDLRKLRKGEAIERPVYDFATHTRKTEVVRVAASPIIILEGILVLHDPRVRKMLDYKIFIDTDADVRVLRRIERDINQRGRNLEDSIHQYLTSVRPMHLEFVKDLSKHADIRVPGERNEKALHLLVGGLITALTRCSEPTGQLRKLPDKKRPEQRRRAGKRGEG